MKKMQKISNTARIARKCRGFLTRLGSLGGDRRGNVLTEMALVMPMFATLAVGTFDMGRFAIEQNRLEQVARAGAQYALQNLSLSGDMAGMENEAIQAALVAAGPDTAGITVVATRACSCPGSAGAAGCDDFCDDGNVKSVELTVTATHTLTPIFSFPSFIQTTTLVADMTVQVQ